VDTLTIRPRWYCLPCLFELAAIVLIVVWAFLSHAGGVVTVVGLYCLGAVVIFIWLRAVVGTKIEVTPTDVTQRSWPHPRLSTRRDEITAMHWYGKYFTFTGADNSVLLKLGSLGWRRSQLLDLSEALGARLYSHRTKWGLGRDRTVGHRMRRDSVRQDTSSPSRHVSG
jgi:hypothetical protein